MSDHYDRYNGMENLLCTDAISRQAAIDALHMDTSIIPFEKAREYADAAISEIRNRLEKLPSTQPDTYWKEQCQSYEQTINKLRESLSAKSESFEWCTDCKEYDQEAHCCHRWSKMIRKTVEEMQIVRCKDCRYYNAEEKECLDLLGYGRRWEENDFCSYAERREDG